MEVFAHRGASKQAPENTLVAFELANQYGANGIELDVHLTKDHVPVIIHDENIRRTTNGVGFVQSYTFEELASFDAGSWYNPKFNQSKIMSLEQFMEWFVKKEMKVNMELKTKVIEYPNIEQIVSDYINQYQVNDRTIISSFNPETIQRFREVNKRIELAWLTKIRVRRVDLLLEEIGANSIHINQRLLSSRMLKLIIERNIPFRVYTVNKTSTMKKCEIMGAKSIITDVPDRALQVLQHT
ncbi:glycerophosphodiester phosphodiesterase [Halalkalibacillus halophilus]|uniref:glycerophosphodiester phosphodiesterase n=1 Tax=Halalkalibacillus halophilus TaxID=392827 RepID=UPI00040B9445|nr:glycerophosphodiester phosphodiesterase [Halalkalibacillus halophilus]